MNIDLGEITRPADVPKPVPLQMVESGAPKVAIVTYASEEYRMLEALTLHNKMKYAARHGFFLTKPDVCDSAWDRVRILYTMLGMGYEYVAWFDCDFLVTNLEIDFRAFFDTGLKAVKSFLMGRDINGPNSGVMLVRNTDQAKLYLTAVLGEGFRRFGYTSHRCWAPQHFGIGGVYEPKPAIIGCAMCKATGVYNELVPRSEQTALEYYARQEDHRDHVWIAPQRGFNSYRYADSVRGIAVLPEWGEWQEGDFGMHLAGIPMQDGHDDALAISYKGKLSIAKEVLGRHGD